MLSRLLNRLIRTRTLGKTMNILFCLASGVGHSIHPRESANHGDRVDSVSPLDKATDNLVTAIKTAAECVPNNLDTCQAREQACQSTADAVDTAVEPTGHANLRVATISQRGTRTVLLLARR